MKKNICLVLLLFFVNEINAQTFPYAVFNSSSGNINVRNAPSISGGIITSIPSGNDLLAYGNSSGWYQVYLPSSSGFSFGYCSGGAGLMQPAPCMNFVTVQNTFSTGLNIRIAAGTANPTVNIGGLAAKGWDGQQFVCTGNTSSVGGATWYEVFLPNNCDHSSGWMSNGNPSFSYLSYTSGTYMPPPSAGSASSVTTTSFQANWTGSIYTYNFIDVSTSPTFSPLLISGYWTGSVGATSYNVTGLTCGTTYYYRIRGEYNYCNLGASATIAVTTTSCTSAPTASFTPSSTSISAGGSIATTNTTTGSPTITYSWSVSPTTGVVPTSSGIFQPSFTFATAGTYTVTLVASNSFGPSTANAVINVSAASTPPVAGFSLSPTTISAGGSVATINTSTGSPLPTYFWSVAPTGGVSFIPNNASVSPTIIASSIGIYTVTLTATNSVSSSAVSHTFTVTPAATLTVTGSAIPQWQREGDDFGFSVKVNTFPPGSSWYIRTRVYNANNTLDQTINFPTITASSDTENTFWSSPAQCSVLKSRCIEGRYVKFEAVLNTTGVATPIVGQTDIIEKKWASKHIVYINNLSNPLKIPLKYTTGIDHVEVSFSRPDNSHSPCGIPGIIGICSDRRRNIINHSIYSSGIQTQTLTVFNEQLKYLLINPFDPGYNLGTVEPGNFSYTLKYYSSSSVQIGSTEVGDFNLTKVGRITHGNPSSNHVVVFIGGIFNTLEDDVYNLNLDDSSIAVSSEKPFSLASYLGRTSNFDTWYIAMGNTDIVKRNAYNLGLALDAIYQATGAVEIDIVCHSKAGLETRALVENPSLTQSLGGSQYNFNSFQSAHSNVVKKVVFLAVPHRGASLGPIQDLIIDLAIEGGGILAAGALWHVLNDYPGVRDLIEHNRIVYPINSNNLPTNIRYGNLTG